MDAWASIDVNILVQEIAYTRTSTQLTWNRLGHVQAVAENPLDREVTETITMWSGNVDGLQCWECRIHEPLGRDRFAVPDQKRKQDTRDQLRYPLNQSPLQMLTALI